jgi:hypothetical protein
VASAGAPLAAAERAHFEPALGMDLGHVRLHTGAGAAQAADALQARAFTAGSDIYFQQGQYAPGNAAGRRLLAHELVHVAQQTGHAGAAGPRLRAGGPLIQRAVCENPDELVQGALPGLLREEGYVPPPPEVLAEMVDAAEFQARTGVPADQLPEETFVGVDRLQGGGVLEGPNVLPDLAQRTAGPAGAGAALNVPVPMSVVPSNSIGLLWTSGHLSIFANVEGSPNVRGFRGNLAWHAGADFLPGPVGRWFSLQLTLGVSGAMRGDRLFALMGKQSVIYLEVDAATAREFSAELSRARYDQPYRYSPPDPKAKSATERAMAEKVLRARGSPQAMMCTNNCITVPLREVEAVLGRHPTAQGVDIATGQRPGGVYDPHAHGRARLMTEYMRNPDLAGGRPGLSTVEVTPGGARVIGYTRLGGKVLLIYGIYQTGSNLAEAWGTEDFPLVAMQEGFTWTGAITGAAVGGAIGGAIACAPGGPISLVCAAVGFLGGLIGGFIGGAIGSLLIPIAVHMVNSTIIAILILVEGITAYQEFGRRVSESFAELVFTGLFTKRFEISPCNWDMLHLPQEPREDIYALGVRIWKQAGVDNADTFLGNLRRPINSYTIPAVLLGHVATDLTQLAQQRGASAAFTPESIGALTPFDFVKQLRAYDLLRFKYDPALLARLMMLPDEQAAP